MARARALSDMRSDVRIAADCVNQTNRHPNSQLTRWINESIQRLREMVTLSGDGYYVKAYSASVSANDPFVVSHVSLTGFIRIIKMVVEVDDRNHTVHPAQLGELEDFGGIAPGNSGMQGPPQYYWVFGDPTATSGGGSDLKIAVLPNPDRAYDLTLMVLPTHTDLSADGDVFDGVAGWEDWVRWDVCCKIAVRDKNAELYQMASTERAKVEAIVSSTAHRRQNPGAWRRVDTRGRRRGMMNWREWRYPG